MDSQSDRDAVKAKDQLKDKSAGSSSSKDASRSKDVVPSSGRGRNNLPIHLEAAAAQLVTAGAGWLAIRFFRLFRKQQQLVASASSECRAGMRAVAKRVQLAHAHAPPPCHAAKLTEAQRELESREALVQQLQEEVNMTKEKASAQKCGRCPLTFHSGRDECHACPAVLGFVRRRIR
jgi:hypothetical protein